jgi:hypothetical protein
VLTAPPPPPSAVRRWQELPAAVAAPVAWLREQWGVRLSGAWATWGWALLLLVGFVNLAVTFPEGPPHAAHQLGPRVTLQVTTTLSGALSRVGHAAHQLGPRVTLQVTTTLSGAQGSESDLVGWGTGRRPWTRENARTNVEPSVRARNRARGVGRRELPPKPCCPFPVEASAGLVPDGQGGLI